MQRGVAAFENGIVPVEYPSSAAGPAWFGVPLLGADAMRSSHLRSTRANHSTTSWSTQPTLNPKALRLLRISSAQPPVGSKDLDHHERHIIVRDWGIASGPKTLSGG